MIELPIANLLTEPVGVPHYRFICAIMCCFVALSMATKLKALCVLMRIELVLNGANVNFIAFGSRYLRDAEATLGMDGRLMALFVIVLAAAEAAVALAIVLNFYNNHETIDIDQAKQLQG